MEHRHLLRRLRAQGFVIEWTGRNHLKVRHRRGGKFVILAGTPGGGRGDRNAMAQLKKIGFDPERKK